MVERADLGNQVYNLLRDEIIRGQFNHGERLHVGKLAERFDVSPTPVKTALARLATEGLVAMGNRGGAFVSSLTESDIDELAEVREMIEQFAGQRAISLATDDDIDLLQALAESLLSRIGQDGSVDYEGFAADDMAFHTALLGMSGNGQLARLYASLHVYSVVRRAHFIDHGNGAQDNRGRSPYVHVHAEHMAIVAALRARNPALLRSAINDHLEGVRSYARHALAGDGLRKSGKA